MNGGARPTLPAWPQGGTQAAGVIGSPVRHSLSPVIHNSAFAELGMDWAYLAFEVPAGRAKAALEGMRALSLAGLSVTMPHKHDIAAAVDALARPAGILGAVNCVVPEDGRLVGHNTDGAGFLAALRADAGFQPSGSRCMVLGAGGAARAAAAALADAGADEVAIVNRTPSRAEEAARLAGGAGRVGDALLAGEMDLVVNATPLGMARPGGSSEDGFPVDPGLLRSGQLLVDLIYEPARTPLMVAAQQRGVRVRNGLEMLVQQAAAAFELWTGRAAPLEVMRSAALSGAESVDRDGNE